MSNRSYAFKKNYRNTKEILTAAYGLIEGYEFADVDEDNLAQPLTPDFATRHGEKPFVVRCRSTAEEIGFVATQITELLDDKSKPTNSNICVIAPSQRVRDAVCSELGRRKIPWAELREDTGFDASRVKISTIESAKGHEFANVFIAGLVDGVLPRVNVTEEDLPREAARLYVAMTRARDILYLTYTSDSQFRPSPFLVPIQGNCTEMKWDPDLGLKLIE